VLLGVAFLCEIKFAYHLLDNCVYMYYVYDFLVKYRKQYKYECITTNQTLL